MSTAEGGHSRLSNGSVFSVSYHVLCHLRLRQPRQHATTLRKLVTMWETSRQVKKALEMLLEHVVAVRIRVLEEEHLDRLASQHALASAY